MRVVVDVTRSDLVALRYRAYPHTPPRPELLELANRMARAMGLPEEPVEPEPNHNLART